VPPSATPPGSASGHVDGGTVRRGADVDGGTASGGADVEIAAASRCRSRCGDGGSAAVDLSIRNCERGITEGGRWEEVVGASMEGAAAAANHAAGGWCDGIAEGQRGGT
jgi:hypothetical protein